MTQFTDFGLAKPILQALAQEGYERPTPIQAQAIPHVMTGRDLCGIAQTGTGKTAAFALPILHRLAETPKQRQPRGCRALVLSPTRELASQIADSFRTYGRHLRLTTTVVFGGVTIGKQERALQPGVDVLVATPGRMLDLIERRSLNLSGVEIFVLDEADQMLDLGFIHDLKRTVRLLPTKRQTLFFSATMPKTIAELASQFLTDPAQVAVAPVATTAERVEQRVMLVSQSRKQALLEIVLRDPAIERVLVFTRTKHGADRVVKGLDRAGIPSSAIHGNKSQNNREKALAAFKAGTCRVLVATDIAARGIDVEAVSHVINFDLPNVPESYVHRIGRTARAGAEGIALSFCGGDERAYLRDIEKLTRMKVPVVPLPDGFVDGGSNAPDPEERRERQPRQQQRPQQNRQRQPEQRRSEQRPHGQQARPGGEPRHQEGAAPNGNRQRNRGRPAGGQPQQQGRPQQQPRPQGAGGGRDGGSLGWLSGAKRR